MQQAVRAQTRAGIFATQLNKCAETVARALVLCVALTVGAAANAGPISIGLHTQDWFFMWEGGKDLKENSRLDKSQVIRWQVSERTLDRYRDLGAEWSVVTLHQDHDGPDGFARIKRLVNEYKKRGIKPVFRLIENLMLYDHLASKSGAMGYNVEYYQWVKQIAEIFQYDVEYYLISNEIDHDIGYNQIKYSHRIISYDQYLKVLETAYKAIKGVNSNLKVADHGITTLAVVLAACEDLLKSGHLADAYRLWRKSRYDRAEESGSLVNFPFMFSKEWARQRISIARDTFLRPGPSDVYQLHDYEDWEALPEIMAWIETRMQETGVRRPLIVTEIGYRIFPKTSKDWKGNKKLVADFDKYSQEDHAQNLAKDFAILLSHNIDLALYWHSRIWDVNYSPIATLYKNTNDPDEFKPYLAAEAYAFLARTLNGRTATKAKLLPQRPGLYEYAFSGSDNVSIVWAVEGNITLLAHEIAKAVKISDMLGKQILLPVSQTLTVNMRPVYLFWSRDSIAQKVQ